MTARNDEINLVAPAKVFDRGEGALRFSGRIDGENISGSGESLTGAMIRWTAKRTAAFVPKKPEPSPLDKPSDFPETYPAGVFGRTAPPQTTNVLIQGATIWTSG